MRELDRYLARARLADEVSAALRELWARARTGSPTTDDPAGHSGECTARDLGVLSQVLDSIPQSVFWKDGDGVYLGCNSVFARAVGLPSPEAVVGLTDFDLPWPREDAEAYRADDHEVFVSARPKRHIVEPLVQADGTHLWIDTTKVPLVDGEGRVYGVLGVYGDITERRRADRALKESEERMRSIFRAAPTGIGVVVNRIFAEVNDRFCDMVGYSRDELLGHSARMIYPSDEHYAEVGREKYRQIAERGTGTVETVLLRKDGGLLDVLMSSSPIDPADLSRGVTFTALDVTESRRAERERLRLEAQLRRAERLESLGTLAGGIAHDFNNILGALLGYTEIAMAELPVGSTTRSHLEHVEAAGLRARDLVRQILTFSREAEQEMRPVRLQPVVEEALRFVRASIPAMVEIRESIDPACGTVVADATGVHQIVMNLCANAQHAMGEIGGVIEVRLEPAEVDAALAARLGHVTAGPHVALSVSDTGRGIAPEAMARIFDPFFTTKPRGEGTGLGLATVHGIVLGHGGAIAAESEPGAGTTFRVYLPITAGIAAREEAVEVRPAAESPRGAERVLVVDDEHPLGLVAEHMLSSLGYEVVLCTDPRDALDKACHGDGFDLVVTDYAMPDIVGTELARRIRTERPGTPVVLVSGLSHVLTPDALEAVGVREVVTKPFTARQLALAVRRALDAADRA